ncbi:hypothetical protein EV207_1584 [Scopulibacillus darangshiensis]|uniref:Permuted papain-like amidase YaeF/Yiix C92 family enzyme n=1 Tax=Scopulibacillus darangshiensis TaxID=442528 RepID=A0A4V2SKI8_9BACL|nr:hypothetical protein [Scopulibacillus darangshiensis]TCP19746.1 hypothetical protein EV207_1584 [Scopulibacillus darangshiensis]
MMKAFQAGDLIFVRGHGPISRLIEWFDGEFSHVAIALSDQVILESQFFVNARIAQMSYEDIEVVDLRLNDEDRKAIIHKGLNMVGKYYDYGQLIWEGIMDILQLKGHNLLNSPNRVICSEILVNLLLSIHWFDDPDDIKYIKDTTPNELYAIVKKQLKQRNQDMAKGG